MSEVMVEVTVCVTVEVNDESDAEQAVVDLLRMVVLPHPLRLLRVYEPVAITEELIQLLMIRLNVFRQSQRDAAARAMISIRREGPPAGLFTSVIDEMDWGSDEQQPRA